MADNRTGHFHFKAGSIRLVIFDYQSDLREDFMKKLQHRLLMACGILDAEGIIDELGHFSVRIPDENRVLMNGKVSPGEATEKDIILMDLNGTKIEGDLEPAKEVPLHLCVYKRRTDIAAIVHTHSPMIVALSIAGVKLRAMDNLGATVFGDGEVPVYEGCGLVDTFEEGEDIARLLGSRNIIVLRGHGNIVTGRNIEEACISAIWAEKAAYLQFRAMQIGRPVCYTKEGIVRTRNQLIVGKAYERAWSYYKWRLTKGPLIKGSNGNPNKAVIS
jgi:L-ribulose-5-phosphate 4-epimerase